MSTRLQSVEFATRRHTNVEHYIIIWYFFCRPRYDTQIVWLAFNCLGVWRYNLGVIVGVKELRYERPDMAVGNGDRSRITINLYRRKVGPPIYAGKTARNEVGRIGPIFPKWLWMRLA